MNHLLSIRRLNVSETRELYFPGHKDYAILKPYFAVWQETHFAYGKAWFLSRQTVFDCHDKPLPSYQPLVQLVSALDFGCAQKGLRDTLAVSSGEIEEAFTGLNADSCEIKKDGVEFYFDYYEDGAVPTGRVSLNQFKVAIEAYVQFLSDPERKPVIVDFPNE